MDGHVTCTNRHCVYESQLQRAATDYWHSLFTDAQNRLLALQDDAPAAENPDDDYSMDDYSDDDDSMDEEGWLMQVALKKVAKKGDSFDRQIWKKSATDAAELSTRECVMLKDSLKASYNELIKKGSGKNAIRLQSRFHSAINRTDDKTKIPRAMELLKEWARGDLAVVESRDSIEGLEENKLILTQARQKFEAINEAFVAVLELAQVWTLAREKFEAMKALPYLLNRYENNKVVNTKAENMSWLDIGKIILLIPMDYTNKF